MSSKQLFGCMGAAFGVVSGVVGGLAWGGASAKAAHAVSVAKKAKVKASTSRRAASAAVFAAWQSQKERAAQKRRSRKKPLNALGSTPRQFRRMFRVKVTAYTPIDTRMEGGRWTATQRDGRRAHGIAVDPRLIPLGTRLWIPGYGHAVADDTGGSIRGHHIDVRLQNGADMKKWGVRNLCVYVLAEPPRKLRRAM